MTYISVTNGCFDCLHAGHYQFLEFCKNYKKDNLLFVLLDSDEKIKKDKGIGRPIFPYSKREQMLMETGLVHIVVPFVSDLNLEGLCRHHKPDFLFKGEDWRNKAVIGREHAKEVVFVPHKVDISTSLIYDSVMKGIGND